MFTASHRKFVACMTLAATAGVSAATADQRNPQADAGFWVALDGSNDNPGSREKPFATIQHAVDQAKPETTIHIGPGVFHERVVIRRSGSPGNPITVRGTLENGRRATRIDGGRHLDPAVWEPAPEIAEGVYKTSTPLDADPEFVTIDGLSLARLNRVAGVVEGGTRKYTANDVLAWPDGPVADSPVPGVDVWEALGGAYTSDAGRLYLRLKDRQDPRNHSIAFSPAGPVVLLDNAGHVTLKDLEIGGGETGVTIQGAQARHNRIEHCRVMNGSVRIQITAQASHTAVSGNFLSMGFLGKQPGPWWSEAGSPASEELDARRFLYRYFKTFASEKTVSDDRSLQVNGGASETLIEDNDLAGGLIGIEVGETSGTIIRNNHIHNFSSVGMALRAGSKALHVENNRIADCNISIRMHEMNSPAGHEAYIRGNVCEQPPGIGTQLYFHFFTEEGIPPQPTPARDATAFIYWNTFLGGYRGLSLTPTTGTNLPRIVVADNIFAGQDTAVRAKGAIEKDPEKFVFASNWILGPPPKDPRPAWLDPTNVIAVPAGTDAEKKALIAWMENARRTQGLDVFHPFTVNGRKFEALPGFAPGVLAEAATPPRPAGKK